MPALVSPLKDVWAQKFHTDDASLPRSSGASDWYKQISNAARPIRSPCDASSVRNFCDRLFDVIFRGDQWWRYGMSAVFSGKQNKIQNTYSRLPITRTFKGNRKKVRVIGSLRKIAWGKVKNSFYWTVNILITFYCRNVKWKLKDTFKL